MNMTQTGWRGWYRNRAVRKTLTYETETDSPRHNRTGRTKLGAVPLKNYEFQNSLAYSEYDTSMTSKSGKEQKKDQACRNRSETHTAAILTREMIFWYDVRLIQKQKRFVSNCAELGWRKGGNTQNDSKLLSSNRDRLKNIYTY